MLSCFVKPSVEVRSTVVKYLKSKLEHTRPLTTIKTLGVILNQILPFNSPIIYMSRTAFSHPLNIANMRNVDLITHPGLRNSKTTECVSVS